MNTWLSIRITIAVFFVIWSRVDVLSRSGGAPNDGRILSGTPV